jgi:hypothetical protein
VQGDRALAGYRMNDSLAIIDISRLLRLLRRIAGARSRVGRPPPMPNCTNWLVSCNAPMPSTQKPVHQLARSWLLERLAEAQFYPCPNCPIKLSCLGFQSERERNSQLPTIPIAVLQKPLICKKCSNSTLVRTFDMACYATGVLIRRIQEVSEYRKSIKKLRNLI